MHLLFERLDEPGQLLLRKALQLGLHLVALVLTATILTGHRSAAATGIEAEHRQDVADRLADRLRIDAVLEVVGDLTLTSTLGLVDGSLHRGSDLVGVHDHLPVDVAGGATHGLDERGLAAQEALLVGIEDAHE